MSISLGRSKEKQQQDDVHLKMQLELCILWNFHSLYIFKLYASQIICIFLLKSYLNQYAFLDYTKI